MFVNRSQVKEPITFCIGLTLSVTVESSGVSIAISTTVGNAVKQRMLLGISNYDK